MSNTDTLADHLQRARERSLEVRRENARARRLAEAKELLESAGYEVVKK